MCFNAPVVELLRPGAVGRHPALANLGPDVLVEPLDLVEVRLRALAPGHRCPLGELLLDQRVIAGIGNIWRCEALFHEGHNPWTPVSAVTDGQLDALVSTAGRLMATSVASRTGGPDTGRSTAGRAGRAPAAGRPSSPAARASRPAPPTGARPANPPHPLSSHPVRRAGPCGGRSLSPRIGPPGR